MAANRFRAVAISLAVAIAPMSAGGVWAQTSPRLNDQGRANATQLQQAIVKAANDAKAAGGTEADVVAAIAAVVASSPYGAAVIAQALAQAVTSGGVPANTVGTVAAQSPAVAAAVVAVIASSSPTAAQAVASAVVTAAPASAATFASTLAQVSPAAASTVAAAVSTASPAAGQIITASTTNASNNNGAVSVLSSVQGASSTTSTSGTTGTTGGTNTPAPAPFDPCAGLTAAYCG